MRSNTRLHKLSQAYQHVRAGITSSAQSILLIRVIAWWSWLRILRPFLTVQRMVSLAALRTPVRDAIRNPTRNLLPSDILHCLELLDQNGLWTRSGECLPKALVCHRFLTLAGLDPTLVIGFDGELGHSWVEISGEPFLDPDSVKLRYPPILILPPGSQKLVKAN